jgi:polysaccharide deacetylase 2 family uncharacterized protein YibQ
MGSRAQPIIGLLLACLLPLAAHAESVRTLIIIIDDIGNHMATGMRAVELPGKLNLAILPYTPNSAELARLTAAAGKEVLLHAPMSNLLHKPLGSGALTTDMSQQQLRDAIIASLADTPHVKGVSNHMGSQLTSMREPMEWLMQELSGSDLYFVDSRTSSGTVAAGVATEYGIPNLSRQVFLDNEATYEAIHEQFQQLLAHADSDGIGIAIGHPYPETLDYLQQVLPTLSSAGYRLALISEVLAEEIRLAKLSRQVAD